MCRNNLTSLRTDQLEMKTKFFRFVIGQEFEETAPMRSDKFKVGRRRTKKLHFCALFYVNVLKYAIIFWMVSYFFFRIVALYLQTKYATIVLSKARRILQNINAPRGCYYNIITKFYWQKSSRLPIINWLKKFAFAKQVQLHNLKLIR